MASAKEVYRYWSDYAGAELLSSYGIEIGDEKTCFACGWSKKVQRAHIVSIYSQRTLQREDTKPLFDNSAKNLHLLCPNCHAESEHLNEKYYWIWLKNKNNNHYKHSLKWTSEFMECVEMDMEKILELSKKGDFYGAAVLSTRHTESYPNEDEIRETENTLKLTYLQSKR